MKIFLSIICTMMFSIPIAFGCTCLESTPEERIEGAEVIFSGKLDGEIWEHSEQEIAANFAVKTVWKGASSFPLIETGDITVVTGVDSGVCGVKFIPDKTYLIYATINEDFLVADSCSGSWFLDGKGDEVSILNQMGSTHHFIDAREIKGTSSDDCRGPGPYSVEQCEFGKLVRNIFLPIGVAIPIVGTTMFFLWRKRK